MKKTLDSFVTMYFDNILVFLKSHDDHEKTLGGIVYNFEIIPLKLKTASIYSILNHWNTWDIFSLRIRSKLIPQKHVPF